MTDMRKEQGFTLIELLIVLAILGILIGIVAMSIGDLTTTATRRGMMSERETVQTAIDTWNTLDAIERPGDEVEDFGSGEVTAVRLVKGDTAGENELAEEDEGGKNFIKYLRRDTRYYYKYDSTVTGPDELIVCNNAEETLCLKGDGSVIEAEE
jgi:prepilin-type N-terminal cleavage/methylation domain-containing protein